MPRKRLLIVEDEAVIAADLAGRLDKLGYEVCGIAVSGEDAMVKTAAEKPDIVLMDIALSGEMSGIEAAGELYARFGVPVIYLTAHADSRTLECARDTEPYGILLKPIRELDLFSALETALRRHTLETRLKASEEKYRRMVEDISDVIYEVDDEGVISYISPAIKGIIGYPAEEIIGKTYVGFFHDDDITRIKNDFNRSMKGHSRPEEYRVVTRSGEVRWVRILDSAVRVNGRVAGLRGVITDITDIIDARESLRKSEERYRILSEITTDAASSLRLSPDGSFEREWAAGTFIQTMGYSLERLGSFDLWLEIVHPDDIHLFKKAMPDLLAGRVVKVEARVFAADGTLRWIRDTVFPYWDEAEQRVVRLVSAVQDITPRKEAERELEAEKARLSITIRDIADGIMAVDREGAVVLFNPAAESLTGWSFGEARGMPVGEILRMVDELSGSALPDPFDELAREGGGTASLRRARLISRDGTTKTVEYSATMLRERFDMLAGAVLVIRDITERVHLEDELRKAQKLESIGELAGGIAHDFNNMLTTVLGNVSLAKIRSEGNVESRRYLENAERAIAQARELTRQLLTFARGGEPIKERLNIGSLVREAANVCLDGRGVLCEFDIPDDLGEVMADKGQLSQVIQNLAINAEQAMPTGGVVRFAARRIEVGEESALQIPAGTYVQLSVADTGVGIPRMFRERVFDPYFSTKQKGSGLGLAIVYSIVKKHGGTVVLDSEEGSGSSFHVYLPAVGEKRKKKITRRERP